MSQRCVRAALVRTCAQSRGSSQAQAFLLHHEARSDEDGAAHGEQQTFLVVAHHVLSRRTSSQRMSQPKGLGHPRVELVFLHGLTRSGSSTGCDAGVNRRAARRSPLRGFLLRLRRRRDVVLARRREEGGVEVVSSSRCATAVPALRSCTVAEVRFRPMHEHWSTGMQPTVARRMQHASFVHGDARLSPCRRMSTSRAVRGPIAFVGRRRRVGHAINPRRINTDRPSDLGLFRDRPPFRFQSIRV